MNEGFGFNPRYRLDALICCASALQVAAIAGLGILRGRGEESRGWGSTARCRGWCPGRCCLRAGVSAISAPRCAPAPGSPSSATRRSLPTFSPRPRLASPSSSPLPMVRLLAKHNRVIDLIRSRGIELRPLSLCIVRAGYC
jgi:hypothetical protein